MSKSFTVKLFEGWIPNQTEIFTDPQFNALLGQADELKFQANVTDFSGTSPQPVVTYYSSCDNVYWNSEKVYTGAAVVAAIQYFWTVDTAGFTNGGFGRCGLKMGAASTKVYVQLYATGRIN